MFFTTAFLLIKVYQYIKFHVTGLKVVELYSIQKYVTNGQTDEKTDAQTDTGGTKRRLRICSSSLSFF